MQVFFVLSLIEALFDAFTIRVHISDSKTMWDSLLIPADMELILVDFSAPSVQKAVVNLSFLNPVFLY